MKEINQPIEYLCVFLQARTGEAIVFRILDTLLLHLIILLVPKEKKKPGFGDSHGPSMPRVYDSVID